MVRTTSSTSALCVLLAGCGAVFLASPWSSGANVGSVDAAQRDEPFDARLLAGPDGDEEPLPEQLAALQGCESPRTSGGSGTGGGAALSVHASLDLMTDESSVVVTGTVDSLRSCLDAESRSIVTVVSLATVAPIKSRDGSLTPDRLSLLVPGGNVGDYRLVVGGNPHFTVGERAVLFSSGDRGPEGGQRH